jgi:hypothetical protein
MKHFTISIDIAAPAERTWAVISDIDRWHEWTPSITSVNRIGGAAFSVGTRASIRQPKFPPAVWEVTSITPGRQFTWVSVAPGLRVIGRHAVEPTADGSRATLSVELEGILAGVWGWMTGGITQRYIGFEAEGLKARSERADYHYR